jgi:hypothetical protein
LNLLQLGHLISICIEFLVVLIQDAKFYFYF